MIKKDYAPKDYYAPAPYSKAMRILIGSLAIIGMGAGYGLLMAKGIGLL